MIDKSEMCSKINCRLYVIFVVTQINNQVVQNSHLILFQDMTGFARDYQVLLVVLFWVSSIYLIIIIIIVKPIYRNAIIMTFFNRVKCNLT